MQKEKTIRHKETPIRVTANFSSETMEGEQWLRIRLPIQRTRVRSLVQEDPTCHETTKPVCHNY